MEKKRKDEWMKRSHGIATQIFLEWNQLSTQRREYGFPLMLSIQSFSSTETSAVLVHPSHLTPKVFTSWSTPWLLNRMWRGNLLPVMYMLWSSPTQISWQTGKYFQIHWERKGGDTEGTLNEISISQILVLNSIGPETQLIQGDPEWTSHLKKFIMWWTDRTGSWFLSTEVLG